MLRTVFGTCQNEYIWTKGDQAKEKKKERKKGKAMLQGMYMFTEGSASLRTLADANLICIHNASL